MTQLKPILDPVLDCEPTGAHAVGPFNPRDAITDDQSLRRALTEIIVRILQVRRRGSVGLIHKCFLLNYLVLETTYGNGL